MLTKQIFVFSLSLSLSVCLSLSLPHDSKIVNCFRIDKPVTVNSNPFRDFQCGKKGSTLSGNGKNCKELMGSFTVFDNGLVFPISGGFSVKCFTILCSIP